MEEEPISDPGEADDDRNYQAIDDEEDPEDQEMVMLNEDVEPDVVAAQRRDNSKRAIEATAASQENLYTQ
jgi:hypothetical protein